MAKVTAPILSGRAAGQIGKTQVYSVWKGVPYARQYIVPANPRTTAQQTNRGIFTAVSDLWKRLGSVSRAPWDSFITGKPLTSRNAIISSNVSAMQGQSDRQLWIGSPGSKGGVSPTTVAGAAGTSSGDIDVTITAPPAPTGWTLTGAEALGIEDGDPKTLIPSPIAEAENLAPTVNGDTVVVLTGLKSATSYVVTGWLKWTKPDGTIAYGASLVTTATSQT